MTNFLIKVLIKYILLSMSERLIPHDRSDLCLGEKKSSFYRGKKSKYLQMQPRWVLLFKVEKNLIWWTLRKRQGLVLLDEDCFLLRWDVPSFVPNFKKNRLRIRGKFDSNFELKYLESTSNSKSWKTMKDIFHLLFHLNLYRSSTVVTLILKISKNCRNITSVDDVI